MSAPKKVVLRKEVTFYVDKHTLMTHLEQVLATLSDDTAIALTVESRGRSLEMLRELAVTIPAGRIASLTFDVCGTEDANDYPPVLAKLTGLYSLCIHTYGTASLDFVTCILESGCNRLTHLGGVRYIHHGDVPRFFRALAGSGIGSLQISPFGGSHALVTEFDHHFEAFLARDMLTKLELLFTHFSMPMKLLETLRSCSNLATLAFKNCQFVQCSVAAPFPKSITKIVFLNVSFNGFCDWSFLDGSNVTSLYFNNTHSVDGVELGRVLTSHLQKVEFDTLSLNACEFADSLLGAIVPIGHIPQLTLCVEMTLPILQHVERWLQSSCRNQKKSLVVGCGGLADAAVMRRLRDALRKATALVYNFSIYPNNGAVQAASAMAAAIRLISDFKNDQAIFAMLQGQQIRRLRSPLLRLPVEMIRVLQRMFY